MNGKHETSGGASWLLGAALCIGIAGGCAGQRGAGAEGAHQSPVIYGEDDRWDLFEYADQAWAAEVAGFTVALMSEEVVEVSPEGTVSFVASTLEQAGMCADERFARQRSAAFCSGTLIAPDLVLTAAHCVPDASACESTRFVFGYQMDGPATLHEVTAGDVFSCAELLVREQYFDYTDHAIVRLDRPADRPSARLASEREAMAAGAPLLVHGFPSGLPIKIDDGGHVRDGRAATRDHFIATLDTSAGSDGSGVFDGATGALVGISVTGEMDYIPDEQDACHRSYRCTEDGCAGQIVEYAFRAIDALCNTGIAPASLCPCGDGNCDAAGGETTATCAADCGSSCGDGACNGAEGPTDCPADCGTCGNAVCADGEDESTCCTDCGCAAPMVCAANACVPDPAGGDTCADVAELRVTGAYVVPGSTAGAADDYAGTCVDDSTAPDRVYGITLAEETWVQAQVSGFDTVLYVRTDCDDPASETMCDDDSGPPEHYGSRVAGWFTPGTYYLVVDGYGTAAGAYDLAVSFVPPPANDTCDVALDIPAAGTRVVTTILSEGTGRNDYQGTCGGTGVDHVYVFTTAECTDLTATTDGIDSVLYLRSGCSSPDAADELACNDDIGPNDSSSSISVADLMPGTHYLIVDGYDASVAGAYTLRVAFDPCADRGVTAPAM
jgi:hypothetical protein